MLVRIAEKIIRGAGEILARIFMALRLSPNAITLVGLAVTTVAGVLFGMGKLTAGGLVLVGACLLDSVDGLVARRTGRVTRFGAFFDSTIDRYSDLVLYAGLFVFAVREPANREYWAAPVAVIAAAVAGAFLVSYTKSRGENMAGEIRQGYWGRVERLIMLIIGVCVWRASAALWILAIFPHITVIHRILIVKAKLMLARGADAARPSREGSGFTAREEDPRFVGATGKGLTPGRREGANEKSGRGRRFLQKVTGIAHRIPLVKDKLRRTNRIPDSTKVKSSRRLWWAKLSDDGTRVIFPLPLRILFIDFKRGSVPYDIACAVFILSTAVIPIQWIAVLNRLVIKYLG
jgi:CDP-diacylglycerol--glycerol-3-phosphate 3-phosphatidyltransferase